MSPELVAESGVCIVSTDFRILVFTTLLFLPMEPPAATCDFHYNDHVRQDIVLTVHRMVRDPHYFPFFNVDNPTITAKGRNIEILVAPFNIVNNHSIAGDPNFIGVLYDPCRKRIVETYWVSEFLSGGQDEPPKP